MVKKGRRDEGRKRMKSIQRVLKRFSKVPHHGCVFLFENLLKYFPLQEQGEEVMSLWLVLLRSARDRSEQIYDWSKNAVVLGTRNI